MTAFTARRALHQQTTPAEITGELPTAMFLHYNPADEAQGYASQKFGWSGCLDAPDLLPVGGVREVYISPEVGGMGSEGRACRNVYREAY